MSTLKLYTLEEIKETFKSIDLEEAIDTFIEFADPIELPSNEEIEKMVGWGGDNDSAINGALWLKEQILNQNK